MFGSHSVARASDPDFQLEIIKGYDPMMGLRDVIPPTPVGSACPATVENRRSTEESSDGTKSDPSLTIVTRWSGNCTETHIRDNASGVSPDTIDRKFNPFVTTRPLMQGAGLGLALSSNVNCRHGGAIRVVPESGVFVDMIVMPPAEPPSETGDDGITDTSDNGREHIA